MTGVSSNSVERDIEAFKSASHLSPAQVLAQCWSSRLEEACSKWPIALTPGRARLRLGSTVPNGRCTSGEPPSKC